MLHAWRKFGLSASSAVYKKDHGGKPDFEAAVRGKIEFIGQIRSRPDALFRSLANQFNQLATTGYIRTTLTPDEIARDATRVIETMATNRGPRSLFRIMA